jgi:hypothetical protein
METLAMVAGVIVVLHLLEAAVLTPKIVGHRVGLSESGALLAVVAGGKLLGFVGVVLAVPIAATVAVLVRYAVRYYETTSFYGRESDADVVVTPSMALIMPGQPWIWTGDIYAGTGKPLADLAAAIRLETSIAAGVHEQEIEPELGPSGAPRSDAPIPEPAAHAPALEPALEPALDAEPPAWPQRADLADGSDLDAASPRAPAEPSSVPGDASGDAKRDTSDDDDDER